MADSTIGVKSTSPHKRKRKILERTDTVAFLTCRASLPPPTSAGDALHAAKFKTLNARSTANNAPLASMIQRLPPSTPVYSYHWTIGVTVPRELPSVSQGQAISEL